jgi:hypothetical protein
MKAHSQSKQQDFAESQPESSDAFQAPAPPVAMQACDAAHSEKNIAEWSSYLPADCVNTMISMGWDVST